MKKKLAIITSHPIQYQAPLWKKISADSEIDSHVYFCWNPQKNQNFDREFNQKIIWDTPLFDGYKYSFLRNFSPCPSSNFWGQINFGIVNELFRCRYDAVLVHGWNSFTNWLVFFIAPFLDLKIILRGENPLMHEAGKNKIKNFLKRMCLNWLFKRVRAFLYIGEENKKFYIFYGAPKQKLIFCPYAVDNDRISRACEIFSENKSALRAELGIGADSIVILFMGKLIDKKRPLDLLMAYKRLKNTNTHLLFIGDGDLKPKLEKYVRDHAVANVQFLGFKNQTELPRHYAIADLLVLPSEAGETWGLVVNEAMCCNLPIIVSDKVGCGPDLVKQGVNGLIFECGSPEKLELALEKLIIRQNNLKMFGEASRQIIKNYSFDRNMQAVKQALNL